MSAEDNGMTRPNSRYSPLQPGVGFALLVGLVVLIAAGKPILFDTLDPDCFWHLRVAEQLRVDGIARWWIAFRLRRFSGRGRRIAGRPYFRWIRSWKSGGWRAALVVQSLLQAAFIVFIALHAGAGSIPNRLRPSDKFTTDSAILCRNLCWLLLRRRFSPAYLRFRAATAALALPGDGRLADRP